MDALGGIRYGAEIEAAAARHGIDPKLLAAVAAQETGGPGSDSGNNIVGDEGHGHGLFQIDDRSWPFASSAAAMNPAANADAAAGILGDDLHRYGGNVRSALSAYNAGSPTATGTTTTWGDGRTLGYADSVLRHYAALGGDPAQLVADNRETATSVNALASLGAAQLPATGFGGAGAGTIAGGAPLTAYGASTIDPTGSSASTASAANTLTPNVVAPTSQSPFAPPVSWANETSASGPAGGKQATDADTLVADSITSSDGAFDDRDTD